MLSRPSALLALVGLAVAALALLWPMRAHHAEWAVTVGTGTDGSLQTSYASVGGGQLVTPIQLLFEGTAPEETATRSALRTRVLTGAAGALMLGAGLAIGLTGRSRGHR